MEAPPPQPLLEGLGRLDWPSSVKTMQEKWIGKSKGAFFDFELEVSGGGVVLYG